MAYLEVVCNRCEWEGLASELNYGYCPECDGIYISDYEEDEE